MPAERAALRIEVRGVVQGVGFRPTVYRIALENAVRGWVLNDGRGVQIHVEGEASQLDAFVTSLRSQAPPAARIDGLECQRVAAEGFTHFEIRPSRHGEPPVARISPDLPVCADCLTELMKPGGRRYGYPYINCTACGPRYSIVQSLPYDRGNTTMAGWPLCEACRSEYENPRDRRYHAQPTACHECGPTYRLVENGATTDAGLAAIQRAAVMLNGGLIVAVKGIGGYHLACSAHDAAAVRRLRERKFRKEKPFALVVRSLESAEGLVRLSAIHRSLLVDCARPIVLAPARASFPGLAEDTDELGVMLPYAPLHELLFHFGAPDPLVMTSANRSSEPIAYLDDDALERLGGIADAFLMGERPIARRVEDSVVAVRDRRPVMIRRARGFTPGSVARLRAEQPVLAVGADLKNAITLVVAGEAIAGPHIGDLGDLETDRAFEETIEDLLMMYEIDRRTLVIVHDSHPEYASTRLAERLTCAQRISVQHHRAHIASVMAEREEPDRPVIGIALDGTGYGDDGTIWGCELFTGSVAVGFRRAAHLRLAQLPGGDAAARYPVQAAAGFLEGLSVPDLREAPFSFPERFFQACELVARNVRCFPTTSAGRLFDTVAALCGFTREITFEGQAAIWLEHQARDVRGAPPYPFPDLDYCPLLASVIADRRAGRDVGEISYAFHAAVAKALADMTATLAGRGSIRHVAVSGGVFQNRLLRSLLTDRLAHGLGFTVYFNERVPANDGGISLGQVAIACAIL